MSDNLLLVLIGFKVSGFNLCEVSGLGARVASWGDVQLRFRSGLRIQNYVMPQARSPSSSDEAPRWVATIIEGLRGFEGF